jgi:hypothetical protein
LDHVTQCVILVLRQLSTKRSNPSEISSEPTSSLRTSSPGRRSNAPRSPQVSASPRSKAPALPLKQPRPLEQRQAPLPRRRECLQLCQQQGSRAGCFGLCAVAAEQNKDEGEDTLQVRLGARVRPTSDHLLAPYILSRIDGASTRGRGVHPVTNSERRLKLPGLPHLAHSSSTRRHTKIKPSRVDAKATRLRAVRRRQRAFTRKDSSTYKAARCILRCGPLSA